MNIEEYLINPCRALSIPYWKDQTISLPDNMLILHNDDFNESYLEKYNDETYFRLINKMIDIAKPTLPNGFTLLLAAPNTFTGHINECYDDIRVTAVQMEVYKKHPTYDADLWVAIADNKTGNIVATGIAEIDKVCKEGILEWVQVSPLCRAKGLGRYLVYELIYRMKNKAKFVTVSGNVNNKTNPEALYRKCGFTGNDIWHILTERD